MSAVYFSEGSVYVEAIVSSLAEINWIIFHYFLLFFFLFFCEREREKKIKFLIKAQSDFGAFLLGLG